MGGGGGVNTTAMQNSYDAGAKAFNSGKGDPSTSPIQTNDRYFAYFKQGYADAKAAAAARKQQAAASAAMMQMMRAMQEQSARQAKAFSANMAAITQNQQSAAAAAAEAKKNADLKRRDTLFSDRMNQASLATDYVNKQINEERATARLLGVEFAPSQEQVKTRINDYFATLWGEGSQKELEALISQYGNPQGFSGTWDVIRGNAANASPNKDQGSGKTLTTSGTTKLPGLATLATDDEDSLDLLG